MANARNDPVAMFRAPAFTLFSGGAAVVAPRVHPALPMACWRVYYNTEAGAWILHGRRRFPLGPRRVTLAPPGIAFRHEQERPLFHLFLHALAGAPYERIRGGPRSYEAPDDLVSLAQNLGDRLARSGLPGLDASGRWLVSAFLSRAFSLIPAQEWPAPPGDGRIRRALRRMENLSDLSIDNDALAKEACLSRNAFVRLFSGEMGVPPMQWFLRRRLEEAARRLAYSEESIESIAAACGFCDRHHFTRRFRREFGVPPGRYRRRQPLL